jgi:hypothetical protein
MSDNDQQLDQGEQMILRTRNHHVSSRKRYS